MHLSKVLVCPEEWEWVCPEEIGALTSAPILGYDVPRDDQGRIVPGKDFRVWAYMDYQVGDPVETLMSNGVAVWQKG